MAKSGSTDYSVTGTTIITEALQICHVVEEGGSPSGNQSSDCLRTLNMLVKNDMKDALHLWLNTYLVVFPVKNQQTLTFGASGDRMCLESELVTTKLNGAHSSGATSLTVDDTTSMATSDVIGIVTDSSGIHWTTISTVDSSTGLTIASGLSDSASDDDRVYTYTTVFAQKIARIREAWIRTTDNIDIPVDVTSQSDYSDLSDKTESGRINQLYFDPQYITSVVRTWPVPDDSYTNDRLYLYVTRYIEDFDAASNDADYPQEWFLPLAWNLAAMVAKKYGITGGDFKEIVSIARDLKEQTLDFDTENTSIQFVPAMDHYTK